MLFHRGMAHVVSNVAWRVVCGRQGLAAAALHSAPESPDWLLWGRWAVQQQPVSPSRWVAGWTGQWSAPNEANVNESVNGNGPALFYLSLPRWHSHWFAGWFVKWQSPLCSFGLSTDRLAAYCSQQIWPLADIVRSKYALTVIKPLYAGSPSPSLAVW